MIRGGTSTYAHSRTGAASVGATQPRPAELDEAWTIEVLGPNLDPRATPRHGGEARSLGRGARHEHDPTRGVGDLERELCGQVRVQEVGRVVEHGQRAPAVPGDRPGAHVVAHRDLVGEGRQDRPVVAQHLVEDLLVERRRVPCEEQPAPVVGLRDRVGNDRGSRRGRTLVSAPAAPEQRGRCRRRFRLRDHLRHSWHCASRSRRPNAIWPDSRRRTRRCRRRSRYAWLAMRVLFVSGSPGGGSLQQHR